MKIPLGKNNLQTSQTNHIANCIVSTQHEPLTETRFPNSHSVVTEKYSLKIAFQKSRQNSSRIHVKEFHTYDYNFTSNKRLHRYFSKILFIILNHLSLYFQVFFIFFLFSLYFISFMDSRFKNQLSRLHASFTKNDPFAHSSNFLLVLT